MTDGLSIQNGPVILNPKTLLVNSSAVPLALSELPCDPGLPGLTLLLNEGRLTATLSSFLSHWLGSGAKLTDAQVYLRRLFPGKRCSVEIELVVDNNDRRSIERRRLLGKFYESDQGAGVSHTLNVLRRNGFAAGRFAVPEPVAWVREYQLLLLKWVDGTPLRSLLCGSADARSQMQAAAEWLLSLHSCGVTTGRRYSFENHLATLAGWKDLLRQAYPEGERVMHALISRFEENCGDLSGWEPRPTHRDFTPEHLVFQRNQLICLDFDEFCQYDPLFDVAHFIAHMRFISLIESGRLDQFDSLCDRFLANYESGCEQFSSKRLHLYLAVSYFKLCRFVALVQRLDEWDAILPQLLLEAERIICRNGG
jgi:hypothetical protein